MTFCFNRLISATIGLMFMVAGPAVARDKILIVGSSTVFPYTQAVAEQFTSMTGANSPVVESTGTGGGMKLFCAGIGVRHPDLTGASRAMKTSEYELCQKNGVNDISEALIGFDGLSIAIARSSDRDWNLTLEQVFLALSSEVPINGEWAANPYSKWSDIDPQLPDIDILAYGPPPTSGTRDAFVELAMHVGCRTLAHVQDKGLDKDKDWIKQNCSRMRQDGNFVEAGENDNLIVQRLAADPTAMGIFGYSFLYENLDILKPVHIEGVAPSIETIGNRQYPIFRPLYIYIKNAHRNVIPGFQEFIEEYMLEDAMGPDGYLADRGLVILGDDVRMATQDAIINGVTMDPR